MITLENYEIFVDKRISKSSTREYFGLYVKIGDKEHLLSFINESLYNYIVSLSK